MLSANQCRGCSFSSPHVDAGGRGRCSCRANTQFEFAVVSTASEHAVGADTVVVLAERGRARGASEAVFVEGLVAGAHEFHRVDSFSTLVALWVLKRQRGAAKPGRFGIRTVLVSQCPPRPDFDAVVCFLEKGDQCLRVLPLPQLLCVVRHHLVLLCGFARAGQRFEDVCRFVEQLAKFDRLLPVVVWHASLFNLRNELANFFIRPRSGLNCTAIRLWGIRRGRCLDWRIFAAAVSAQWRVRVVDADSKKQTASPPHPHGRRHPR